MWAKELIENSHRDQLSLNYCIWKLNIKNNIDNFSQNVFILNILNIQIINKT